MLSKIKFVNNASVRITKALQASDTTIEVADGDADFFPQLGTTDEYFILTLLDDAGNFEIVKCTSRTSSSFAVERAQEGTTAKDFKKGSVIENRLTAGSITQIFQQVIATESEHGIVRLATEEEVSSGVTKDTPPAVITPETIMPTLLQIKQDAFIAGGIVAFSGKFVGNNPVPKGGTEADTNWHICNGENGTPDLRNRFIMGCGAVSNIGQIGGSNTMSGTTGPATLSIAQLPAHKHNYTWEWTGTGWQTAAEPWDGHKTNDKWKTSSVGNNEPHYHPLNMSVDNRPAYYTLAYIMKIK